MEARPRPYSIALIIIMIVIIENRHKFDRLRTTISFSFWQKKKSNKMLLLLLCVGGVVGLVGRCSVDNYTSTERRPP